jgi:hypothetical protein
MKDPALMAKLNAAIPLGRMAPASPGLWSAEPHGPHAE